MVPGLVLPCLQGALGPQLQEPPCALLRALDPAVSVGPIHNSGDGIRAKMVPIGCVMALR